MLPIYLEFVGVPHGFLTAPIVLVYTIAIGLLMVSRVPTWSGKMVGRRISRELVLPIFVLAVIYAALLFSSPFETMAISSFIYIGCLPLWWTTYHRRLTAEAAKSAAKDDAEKKEQS